jgi:hypothetical protein
MATPKGLRWGNRISAKTRNPRQCKLCGYNWGARVPNPRSCPNCKRYDWEETKPRARLVAASEIEAHPAKSLLARDYVQQEPMSFKPETK